MVSSTGDDGMGRATDVRESRLEHVGQGSLILGISAMIIAAIPGVREAAWIPAVPAVILAMSTLGLGVQRKRYAVLGLVVGWFAFAYSFAMMLWG
jgi:hypothetical protein